MFRQVTIAVLGFSLLAGVAIAAPQAPELPPAPSDAQMRAIAQREFELGVEEILPMSPEQIEQFRATMKKTTEAMRQTEPPKLITRTERLNLEPGSVPPTLRIVPGYGSAVVFYDVSGAPWPIRSVTPGNPKLFAVTHESELAPFNLITISPLARHADTSLTIVLEDQSLPVILRLTTDDQEKGSLHDSLVSYQANMRGPKAEVPVVGGRQAQSVVDPTLLAFLDGIPPAGSVFRETLPKQDGVDVWEYKNEYYLRTKHSAVWPAWTGIINGTANYKVYRLPAVPSLMVSVGGSTQTLMIGDEQK